MTRWWWCYSCQMVFVTTFVFMVFLTNNPVRSQPQANLLITGCSQVNATNRQSFSGNLNETFRDLRSKLSNNNTYFATSEQTRNSEPVYAMAQCRNYMSTRDCLSCFDSADRFIRSCAAANGARAVLDGCFLRYESNSFYDQTTLPGNVGLCGNRTSSRQSVFETAVDGLLSNLSIATPKISGYYAAVTAPVSGTNTSTAYAIAQCAGTVTRDGCKDCLAVAYANIKSCATDVIDGRAVDSGCFMRFSDSAFFDRNKTTDITSFLRDGGSSNKGAIIGGVVGGVGALFLFIVVVLLWCRRLEKTAPGGKKRGTLNWKQRCDIIFGTARGLAYLHELYHVTIIHRDIKPGNILLDNDFQPKIADFGLARLLPEDQTHISTRFAGTLGYTAPEYAIRGQLSEKVDTYSFGIVVLEIVSGKRCTDVPNESVGEQYLLEHAWNLYESRMHLKLVDESLDPSEYNEEDIKKVIEIALMCTQSPVSVRPTMSEVVMLLSDRSRVQNPPSRQNIQVDNLTSITLSMSNADATITELTGR